MTATIAYPGPKGSHSSSAAVALAPEARGIDVPSFSAVVDAVADARVSLGVLPIESSLAGPIAETHDLLYGASLSIVREATLPVEHCVVGLPGATLEGARILRSHPAAFDQCRRFLAERHVQQLPAATTADAAREVADSGDPTQLAVAGPDAAAAYGLRIVAGDVSDRPGSTFTRFVAVAPYTIVAGGADWRTALSFVTDHRPGALHRALGPFARNGVNLVQLVSRPLPDSSWRYRFDVVLDGCVTDGQLRAAFAELRPHTRELRVFGSYAAERTR